MCIYMVHAEGVAMVLHVLACTHKGFHIVLHSLEWALGSLAESCGGGWVGAAMP